MSKQSNPLLDILAFEITLRHEGYLGLRLTGKKWITEYKVDNSTACQELSALPAISRSFLLAYQ